MLLLHVLHSKNFVQLGFGGLGCITKGFLYDKYAIPITTATMIKVITVLIIIFVLLHVLSSFISKFFYFGDKIAMGSSAYIID